MAPDQYTIDPKTVNLLWDYMIHADGQILKAAEELTEKQYSLEQGISLGSVQKLLIHCMDAQHIWLERLKGVNQQFASPQQLPLRAIREVWTRQHNELRLFAAAQTVESLKSVLRFHTRKGDPYELAHGACMLHVCDHATYHRGQLNSMIKLAGGTASNVMFFSWSMEQGFGRAGWLD